MPRPTSATTVQRPDLGAIAYEHMMNASRAGFIGLQLLPIFDTPEKTADYPVIPIESLLKLKSTRRAPRSGYPRGDWEFETGTFNCEEYGWEEPVDDTEASLYRRFFDAEEVATIRATDQLLRNQEKRIADAMFNTGNFSNSAITNEWDDLANATPKADVDGAIDAMRTAAGVVPNVIVMTYTVFKNVLVTTELKTYLQYTSPHLLQGIDAQKETLARYFGVDRVLVGNALYDSAAQGAAFSLADIWSNEYVGFFKVSPGGMDLRDPCVGRSFLWTGDSPQNLVVEQYREEQTRSNIFRVRHNIDEAFVFTGAGYLLTNATT